MLVLQQFRFKFKWLDCRRAEKYKPPNLQVFLHGWGSFEKVFYEIPLAQVPQVFQLEQETVLTLPSKGKECSFYESGSLDECLESSALWYANDIVSCIEKPQRKYYTAGAIIIVRYTSERKLLKIVSHLS